MYKIHKKMMSSDSEQIKLPYETMTATDGTQSKKLTVTQYIEKKLLELLVEMIIMDKMSFFTIKRKCFFKFVRTMEPQFSMHSL